MCQPNSRSLFSFPKSSFSFSFLLTNPKSLHSDCWCFCYFLCLALPFDLVHPGFEEAQDAQGVEAVDLVDNQSDSGSDSDSETEQEQENHRVSSKTSYSSRSFGAVLDDSSLFHHSNLTNQQALLQMATTRAQKGTGGGSKSTSGASKSGKASASKSGSTGSPSKARGTKDRTPKHKKGKKRAHEEDEQSGGGTPKQNKESTPTDMKALIAENEKLKATCTKLAEDVTQKKQSNKKDGTGLVSALKECVKTATKNEFFKIGKFISDQKQLERATEIVLDALDPEEMATLGETEKAAMRKVWVANHQDIVRAALNEHRNYVGGELYKVFKDFVDKDKLDEVPDAEEILQVALQNGMEDKDKECDQVMDTFIFYWDVLMPKVSGHKHWGPGKRHHGLLSFMRPEEDPNKQLHVTPSDEAFLVVCWENYLKRWIYDHKQAQRTRDQVAADEAKAKKEAERLKKEGKVPKPHPDSVSPYTLPKSGVSRYGGWNKAGRDRYKAVLDLIKASKEKPNLRAIEQEALTKIRKIHKIEERESKRKAKKSKDKLVVEEEDLPDWF